MNVQEIENACAVLTWMAEQAASLPDRAGMELCGLWSAAGLSLAESRHHVLARGLEPYDAMVVTAQNEAKLIHKSKDVKPQ
jgi:hypothetical protein